MASPSTHAALVKQPNLCLELDMTRSGLSKLIKRDPTFPRPIKDGQSRQSAVYYVRAEINSWLAARIAARDAANDGAPTK
jgi:prophage regulatory protein